MNKYLNFIIAKLILYNHFIPKYINKIDPTTNFIKNKFYTFNPLYDIIERDHIFTFVNPINNRNIKFIICIDIDLKEYLRYKNGNK